MKNLPSLVSMFLLGALLGAMYLAGLWLTVQRICSGQYPLLRLMTSLVTRMGLLAVAFYFIIAEGDWQHLLAALAGFVTLRTLTVRQMRRRLPMPVIE